MTAPEPAADVPNMLEAVYQMMEARRQRRASRAATAWATLRPYERRILREAAVMGYVLGYQSGQVDGRSSIPADGRTIPPDDDIVRTVVEHCDSADGYHYLTDACAGFRRRVTRKRGYPGEFPPRPTTQEGPTDA